MWPVTNYLQIILPLFVVKGKIQVLSTYLCEKTDEFDKVAAKLVNFEDHKKESFHFFIHLFSVLTLDCLSGHIT